MSVARLRTPACLAALGTTAVLLLSACGSSGGSGGSASDGTGFPQGTGEITTVAPAHRKAAPDIGGTTLEGEKITLSRYKGDVVVLNVWGSWCAPCRQEAPYLAKVAKSEKSKGVRFLGLNTRDPQTTAARAFEKDFGIDYPSIYDRDGKLVLKFKGNLPPQTVPSTLIIDRQGRIAVRMLKQLNEAELRKALDPIAAEKA